MPTTTEAQVCNLALALVGHRQFLDSLAESSTEAKVCAVVYPKVRDSLLSAAWWRFATKRVVLALSTEVRSGWGLAYSWPTDVLAARYIYSGTRNPDINQNVPYAKELNAAGTGHLLLTDMEGAEFCYTAQLDTVALWPPAFVEAIAAAVAVRLALALPVKPETAPQLATAAKAALLAAVAVDASEGRADRPPKSEFVSVR